MKRVVAGSAIIIAALVVAAFFVPGISAEKRELAKCEMQYPFSDKSGPGEPLNHLQLCMGAAGYDWTEDRVYIEGATGCDLSHAIMGHPAPYCFVPSNLPSRLKYRIEVFGGL